MLFSKILIQKGKKPWVTKELAGKKVERKIRKRPRIPFWRSEKLKKKRKRKNKQREYFFSKSNIHLSDKE